MSGRPRPTWCCASGCRRRCAGSTPTCRRLYLRQAVTEILTPSSQDAITENRRLHEFLVHGYRGVTYLDNDSVERNPTFALLERDPAEPTTGWPPAR